jgi:hypothetical protein
MRKSVMEPDDSYPAPGVLAIVHTRTIFSAADNSRLPVPGPFQGFSPQKQLPRQFALAGQQWGRAVGFRRMPNGAQLFIGERLHARIVFMESDIFQVRAPRKTLVFRASGLWRVDTSLQAGLYTVAKKRGDLGNGGPGTCWAQDR